MDFDLTNLQIALIGALALWEISWKGFALWRAAQRHQSYWFVALLVINSVGILPILYLMFIAPKDSNG